MSKARESYFIKTTSGHYLRDWSMNDPKWSDTLEHAYPFFHKDGAQSKIKQLRDIGVKAVVVAK